MSVDGGSQWRSVDPSADTCREHLCGHAAIDERYPDRVGFRCPDCGAVSWNINDYLHGWCAACTRFTTGPHGDEAGRNGDVE